MSTNSNRRIFLKNSAAVLAGASLLPYARFAKAASTGSAPLRYVQIMTDYSVIADQFWPRVNPTNQVLAGVRTLDLSALTAAQIPPNLAPFSTAGLLSKMSMIRGAGIFTYTDHNHSAATTGSGHMDSQGIVFPFSIDEVLARSPLVYETVPLIRSLCLQPSVNEGVAMNFSMFDDRLSSLNWKTSALQDVVFGDSSPAGVEAAGRRLSVIDFIKSRANVTSQKASTGPEDKRRLAAITDILSDIHRRTARTGFTCNAPTLVNETTQAEAVRNQAKIIASAFACDLTRIAAVTIRTEGSGNMHEHHHLSIPGNDHAALLTAGKTDVYTQIASILRELGSMPDVDGRTVLDNTVVLIGSEYGGYGGDRAHTFGDMPIIVAGGGGGLLRMGQYIDYRTDQSKEASPGRVYNNLLVSIFNSFGLSSAQYEQKGVVGFGDYRVAPAALGRFLTNQGKRSALDHLYTGPARS
ncbi:MAG: DUF1552 domain-containing protein [Proteobacteria bacterium]|nr:MAG: DUF1552 domain-containing protein [Pseudomonadota bacterium]